MRGKSVPNVALTLKKNYTESMKTLIKNIDTLVSCDDSDRILRHVDLLIDGGRIAKIGTVSEQADKVIDGSALFVYPGLVNTHHHLYQYFTRNLPEVQGFELFDWLTALYEIWKNLDMAVFGLGAFTSIKNYPLNSFTPGEQEYLTSHNVIGDILARFFNKDGYIEPLGRRFRFAGITLENLSNAQNKVCICGGSEKVLPIIHAARNGLFDTLITDFKTINEINTYLNQEGKL